MAEPYDHTTPERQEQQPNQSGGTSTPNPNLRNRELGIRQRISTPKDRMRPASSSTDSELTALKDAQKAPTLASASVDRCISADEVLHVIGEDDVSALSYALIQNGMAHLFRGHKPFYWMEASENTLSAIQKLQLAGFVLKPGYSLVSDKHHGAFLAKHLNVLNHIEEKKRDYEQLMFEGKAVSTESIANRLLDDFPDPHNRDVRNQTLLGGALHYGFQNAAIYARLLDTSISPEEKQNIESQQLEALEPPQTDEVEIEENVIRPPMYCAWPNLESFQLRDIQRNDCQTIQASLAHIDDEFDLHATTAFINDFMMRKA